MMRYLLLLLSLKLCGAAQPLKGEFPTLFVLCLQNLKKLPPTQFSKIQMLPPSIKETFVAKYGPLYIPTLFNVEANDHTDIVLHSSCEDMRASIDDAKRMHIYKKIDNCWHLLDTITDVDMVTFCPSGKRCAYAQGNKVSLYQLDERTLPVHGIQCGGGTLNALAFHDDYLFIKAKTNRCEQEDLFVWNFLHNRHAECYSLWPENARFMINNYACRIIEEHAQDQTWLTYAFNQILFTCILNDIKTIQELELFEQHQESFVCGSQSLFKHLAIVEKRCKLKKKDASSGM